MFGVPTEFYHTSERSLAKKPVPVLEELLRSAGEKLDPKYFGETPYAFSLSLALQSTSWIFRVFAANTMKGAPICGRDIASLRRQILGAYLTRVARLPFGIEGVL